MSDSPSNPMNTALERLLALYKEADEERYQEMMKHRTDAQKFQREGDGYGFNFYSGLESGLNYTSIFFYRVRRELEALLKASSPVETMCEQRPQFAIELPDGDIRKVKVWFTEKRADGKWHLYISLEPEESVETTCDPSSISCPVQVLGLPVETTAFRHWAKDTCVPYTDCRCATCEEKRSYLNGE